MLPFSPKLENLLSTDLQNTPEAIFSIIANVILFLQFDIKIILAIWINSCNVYRLALTTLLSQTGKFCFQLIYE